MRRIFPKHGGASRRRGSARESARRDLSAPSAQPGLLRLRSELDRLFEQFFGPEMFSGGAVPFLRGAWTPIVDVIDGEKEFTVRAEIPGLGPEDVQLTVSGNALLLSGEKKEEREDREKGFVRSERRYGSFRRMIPIPAGADPEKVSAEYDRGMLTVHLPKSDARKPRQISVSAPRAAEKQSRPESTGPESRN
jgi:HSP20 family protein